MEGITMEESPVKQTETPKAKESFSPIQSRTCFASNLSTLSLCPSMDLLVLANKRSLVIHRTVSWQRLASRVVTNAAQAEPSEAAVDCVCWSPDGRDLAVATRHQGVTLHDVENIGDAEAPESYKVSLEETAQCMTWAHVGQPHPLWNLTDAEVERRLSWTHRAKYLDRASHFLPPVHGKGADEEADRVNAAQSTFPSCQKPLSVLFVKTEEGRIRLFLHGRYPIADIANSTSLKEPDNRMGRMVCSSDLSRLLVLTAPSLVSVYAMPALATHRYSLQTISALYCSMTTQLETIQQHMQEILASWKSSLKPLDTKLSGLKKMLTNYGVSSDLRTILLDYIRLGDQASDSSTTSALDQFFTSVQMNDQLIQRLEKSLHASVANVETSVRSGLLRPARTLVYEAGQLIGLEPLLSPHHSQTVQQACHTFYITAQVLAAQVVEARFRLREFVSWLRSVSAHAKAKGTPPKSVQRGKEAKRRVPPATIDRLTEYFMQKKTSDVDSVTEGLLDIPVSDFFLHKRTEVNLSPRPGSPKSIQDNQVAENDSFPTLFQALKRTQERMKMLFDEPRSYFSRSLAQQDWTIASSQSEPGSIELHTRIGCNATTKHDDTLDSGGFFQPQLLSGDPALAYCRDWSLVAKAANWEGTNDSVQLFAIPLGWKDGSDDDDGLLDDELDLEETTSIQTPFYLSARLVLPPDYSVKEVAFYGDDGKSSLSSATDSGTGKEGRQAMGLLVARNSSSSVELWLVQYDNLIFKPVMLSNDDELVLTEEASRDAVVYVRPLSESSSSTELDAMLYAKTRRIPDRAAGSLITSTSRLILSGSRGVGGICASMSGLVSVDLFDLEEDEEDDDGIADS